MNEVGGKRKVLPPTIVSSSTLTMTSGVLKNTTFAPIQNHTPVNYSIEVIRLLAVVLITFTHTRHNLESGPWCVLLEEVPKYGTLMLSIVSGYLY